jgi:hypothetical protein
MYLQDAAKAGQKRHFKHAVVFLDKALNKIEQQRPQLKHNVKLQQSIDEGDALFHSGFAFHSRAASDIERKRKEIRQKLRSYSEKLTTGDPLIKDIFFERLTCVEGLDAIFCSAVHDVPVTRTNVFVLLALVARCALHRWAKNWGCRMCSCAAGCCGALKRRVGAAGEAVVAAVHSKRKRLVIWCVGESKEQSSENLQRMKQYVRANPFSLPNFDCSACPGLW